MSDSIPQALGMWGSKRCLMVAGFDAANQPDGVGSDVVVLNIDSGAIELQVRLKSVPGFTNVMGRGGVRILEFDGELVYADSRTADHTHALLRYRLDDLPCAKVLPDRS